MRVNRLRYVILLLSLLSLAASLLIPQRLVAIVLAGACLLTAVVVLYLHLEELTPISPTNPKMRTLRGVTLCNIALVAALIACMAAMEAGLIVLSPRQEAYFAAGLLAAIMLFVGNISPKLPFNRHTGLRLPWTVRDEDTWVAAHRILGYISFPLALLLLALTGVAEDLEALVLLTVVLWVGIPGGLSYLYYRRKYSAG
ncbi:MAG: SdpI family protein [Oscillospiraceae bacterium]